MFLGDVHAVTVSAALNDGSKLARPAPVVASGVSAQVVRVGPLTAGVVGATESVRDATGRARGSCDLTNPH